MSFDTLSDRLKLVANESLQLCRSTWGRTGLRCDEPIDASIHWQPTFFLKPNRALILAVEVSDVILPNVLKIAAHDIARFNAPISVYQACALDVFQRDPHFALRTLRDHGFGIITVDGEGNAEILQRANPLAQHIQQAQFDVGLRPLNPKLRVMFKDAFATYQTSVGQGLQEAGQIIEALVVTITSQAILAGVVDPRTAQKGTAGKIDDLYPTAAFQNHRATLGAARDFSSNYRNTASHPAQTAREVVDKVRKCRDGFLRALHIAGDMRAVIRALGYKVQLP